MSLVKFLRSSRRGALLLVTGLLVDMVGLGVHAGNSASASVQSCPSALPQVDTLHQTAGDQATTASAQGVRGTIYIPTQSQLSGLVKDEETSSADIYLYKPGTPDFVQFGWYVGVLNEIGESDVPKLFFGEHADGHGQDDEHLRGGKTLDWGAHYPFKIIPNPNFPGGWDAYLGGTRYFHSADGPHFTTGRPAFNGEINSTGDICAPMWALSEEKDGAGLPVSTLQGRWTTDELSWHTIADHFFKPANLCISRVLKTRATAFAENC